MRYYEDMQHTSENRMPPRAHYIPGGAAQYILLNGDWHFAFFPNGDAAEEPQSWDTIPVPSCWQLHGYEYPNYSNVNFPHPVDPPYVPNINPLGVYEREFCLEDDSLSTYLMLEGVCSCAEVYVNGRYVGFTQGSHLQAEFDLTAYVQPGTNTLRVRVWKWCVGSYLEDQDFLRFNGIFRDVYLLRRPRNHLTDFEITTDLESVTVKTDKPAQIRILDAEQVIAQDMCRDTLTVRIPQPRLWNAEAPYLYTLELCCAGEIIRQKFGLRTVAVSPNRELLINGTPVMLRGVNHHDTTPDTGWVISPEQIKKDLELMKQLHINTIRTSHYPPSPYLVELANEMGFYVVLETDIESHGFIQRNPNVPYHYDNESPDWPGNFPQWSGEHLERMERALERFKNQTAIFMWSTGNESAHCPAHAAMLDYIHRRDPSRLAHCEDESRAGSWERADVFSGMYLPIEALEELANSPKTTRPVFLCEYSHAMGNGPGDVWDYWEFFLSHPGFIGGCIWEWCDHALRYEGKLCYGGDFPGEKTHDGNFCCDGMLFADRSFKPGTMEIAAAYAPLRAAWRDGKLQLTNLYDFTAWDDRQVNYRVCVDGACVCERTVSLPLAPRQTGCVALDCALPRSCSLGAYVDITLCHGDGTPIASTQVELDVPVQEAPASEAAPAVLQEQALTVTVAGSGFAYTVSKQTGNLTSLRYAGRELLAGPVTFSAFRAPTDNEKHMVPLWTGVTGWQGENLENTFNNVHEVTCENGCVRIVGALAGISRRPYLRYTLLMRFLADGTVCYDLDGTVAENAQWLPRLGFHFPLAKKDVPFTYYAMGPLESYCDSCHHGRVDYFQSTAQAEFVPYVMPQEHGNHIRAKELVVDDTLRIWGDQFQFQLLPYSTHQLYAAKHVEELPPSSVSYLRVDYKNSGLGSASCGPALAERYRLNEKQIRFRFCLQPK